MKKRLIMVGLAMLTMANTVQGQGFLKKLGNALDKATEKVDKVTKKVGEALTGNEEESAPTTKKKAQASTSTMASSADNDDDGYLIYPNLKRSQLFRITQKSFDGNHREKAAGQYVEFKTTASTKVVPVEKLGGLMMLGFYSDNRVFVLLDKEAFCLDDKGNVVKRWGNNVSNYFNYTYFLPHFDSGRVLLRDAESDKVYRDLILYDKDFKALKKIPDVEEYTYYQDGVAFVHYKDKSAPKRGILYNVKEKFAYYDVNGNQVMSAISSPLDAALGTRYISFDTPVMPPVSDGLVAYVAPKDKRGSGSCWGFRDKNGKVVLPAKNELVQDFSCGLAAVATSESGTLKWGFIDKTGRMVIEPKYTKMPSKFDVCGLALVRDKENNLMFIDKSGQIVSKKFKSVTPFYNGKAFCYVEGYSEENRYYGSYTALIDDKFNELAMLSIDNLNLAYGSENKSFMDCYFNPNMCVGSHTGVSTFADGRMYLKVQGLGLCLISETGDLLKAGLAGPFINGLAPVVRSQPGGKYTDVGYVNMQGEWVVRFEENEF